MAKKGPAPRVKTGNWTAGTDPGSSRRPDIQVTVIATEGAFNSRAKAKFVPAATGDYGTTPAGESKKNTTTPKVTGRPNNTLPRKHRAPGT